VIRKQHIKNAVLMLVALPVLGIMLGGIYLIPAMKITREKDPWLTLLLSLGLSATVFGLGLLLGTPIRWITILFAVGIILLLIARRLHGSLVHNLERFGIVHAPMLFLSLFLGALSHKNNQQAEQDGGGNSAALRASPWTFGKEIRHYGTLHLRHRRQG
jgi:hypothetical protein